jgi:Fe2+ or Zn2+ uptake regulation protein
MGLKKWRQSRKRKKLLKMLSRLSVQDLLAAHYESHTKIDSYTFYELILCRRVRGNIYANFISVYNHMLKFTEKDIISNFEHDQRYSSFEDYE